MIKERYVINVKLTHSWNADDVRNMCVDRNLYTKGTNEDYESMLQYVEENSPRSLDEVYTVARDILDHTDPAEGQTIENIMFVLANDIIKRNYEDIKEWCPPDKEDLEYDTLAF